MVEGISMTDYWTGAEDHNDYMLTHNNAELSKAAIDATERHFGESHFGKNNKDGGERISPPLTQSQAAADTHVDFLRRALNVLDGLDAQTLARQDVTALLQQLQQSLARRLSRPAAPQAQSTANTSVRWYRRS
jgi:hypothetical protein